MTDNRYEVIEWRGHKFDRMTIAAIEAAEHLLGSELDVAQGSYNTGGVGASAGTHDGGGAVDFEPGTLPKRTVRVLRSVGFAAWERQPIPGVWGHHIHAVLIGNDKLAPVAARQVTAYENGRDGLKDNAPDPTWRPSPIKPYEYTEEDMPLSDEDIAKIAKAVWDQPIGNLDDGTKPARPARGLFALIFNKVRGK